MHRPVPRSRPAAPLLAAAVLCTALFSGGCSKPLLSAKDERSPFDRYDAVRSQYASQYVEDEYGQRQPNLRERLRPRR